MAYTVNGKVYTDHPLMDEVIYNTKRILSQIVIKNEEKALQYEDEESLENYEILQLKAKGKLNFDTFPFTATYLKAFGFGTSQIELYLSDRYSIDESIRDNLLEFCIDYFDRNFEERNSYYRSLIGLPPFESGNEYYITYKDRANGRIGYGNLLPKAFIKSKTTEDGTLTIDTSLPLHLQTKEVINVLQDSGGIDKLRTVYRGFNYSYILYLADKSLDLMEIRAANQWDILYMPTVEALIEDRFREIYYLNRDKYLKDYYQEAYKYESTYYDETMIVLLLCQTFTDLIVDIPEFYIRRDIFDIRSVQYFLESYGVEFFPEIPMKYQIRIVKGLNKLIKYKSTNRNTTDILDIFGLRGTSIYKYYLYKKRATDLAGKYIQSDELEKMYELLFVATEIGDTYDNYIKDNIYSTPYDDITLEDKYWDGEHSHAYTKHKHLEKDFTLESTKYMSVEYKVSMEDYLKQQEYFVGLLLSTAADLDDLTVVIPSISDTTRIKVSNLMLFLLALSESYEGIEQIINIPDTTKSPWTLPDLHIDRYYHMVDAGDPVTEIDDPKYIFISTNKFKEHMKYTYMVDINGGSLWAHRIRSDEDLLDWKKKYYGKDRVGEIPGVDGMFETSKNRVYGFNNVDKDLIESIISQRHSMFGFSKGFTLADFGLDKYINPEDASIHSMDDFIELYNNNISIYCDLKDRINNIWYKENDNIEAFNHDDYKVMEFLFRAFFTKDYDDTFYKLTSGNYATRYSDLLRDRDFTLFTLFDEINSESNMETRRTSIRTIMNDVIDILSYYTDQYNGLDYVYAFTSTASHNALLHYMHILINFFKSYKVYFIDPYVSYISDDKNENNAQPIDGLFEHTDEFVKVDSASNDDSYYVSEEYLNTDSVLSREVYEVLDISSHFEPDPDDDYDYDGLNPDSPDDGYKMADGGVPDDMMNIPYIMLDAGRPHYNEIGWWDLDGGGVVLPTMKTIRDIDGGTPLNPEDYRRDYFGTMFTYSVDDGYPRFCEFISDKLSILVEDHQIFANVNLSRMEGNKIEARDDGIFVADQWVHREDFDDLVRDSAATFTYYDTLLAQYASDVHVVADDDLINARIVETINKNIAPIPEVLEYEDITKLDDEFHVIVDNKIARLEEEFSEVSPIGTWTTLEDE